MIFALRLLILAMAAVGVIWCLQDEPPSLYLLWIACCVSYGLGMITCILSTMLNPQYDDRPGGDGED